MELHTAAFGSIQYHEDEVINFPKGLLGFEECKKYILFSLEGSKEQQEKQENRNTFYILHSIEEEISFFLLDPFNFFPDYDIQLQDAVISELEIERSEDVLVFTIVTSKGDLRAATTNLVAPIVINQVKKKAKQVVLDKGKYLVKQPLFTEQNNQSKQEGAR